MSRPRVYVTRRLPRGALDLLAQQTDLQVWEGELPPPREELQHQVATCDGILTLLTDRIDAELLAPAPRLLVVSNMATGFDNIDVAAASRRTVLVARTPGVLSETVADFTLALLLAAARRVAEADRHVRQGLWKTWGPQVMLGQDVHGATLGIVGLGGVGGGGGGGGGGPAAPTASVCGWSTTVAAARPPWSAATGWSTSPWTTCSGRPTSSPSTRP